MPERMNVRYAAELAKLAMTEEEERRLEREMADVLAFVRQLDAADDAQPSMEAAPVPLTALRADEVRQSLAQETVLQNAPARRQDHVIVPRTVE